MKYWSKLSPDLTADTLSDELDVNGCVPAIIHDAFNENGEPIPDPFYTLIKLDEWSPVPLEVWEDGFDHGFLVIDQEGNIADTVEDEDVAKAVLKAIEGIGYVPITVNRYAMVARKV